jgi:hypothetical protein
VYAALAENEEALHPSIVDACQTIRNFERMWRSMMRRVEACTEYHEHFEHLLQIYTFSYNSQIKKYYILSPYYVSEISLFYSVTTTENIDTP